MDIVECTSGRLILQQHRNYFRPSQNQSVLSKYTKAKTSEDLVGLFFQAYMFKWDWMHLIDLPLFFTKRTILWLLVCFPTNQAHSGHRSSLKWKNSLLRCLFSRSFSLKSYRPAHDKSYNRNVTSEDLDQPAHSHSLIRVFADSMCL